MVLKASIKLVCTVLGHVLNIHVDITGKTRVTMSGFVLQRSKAENKYRYASV